VRGELGVIAAALALAVQAGEPHGMRVGEVWRGYVVRSDKGWVVANGLGYVNVQHDVFRTSVEPSEAAPGGWFWMEARVAKVMRRPREHRGGSYGVDVTQLRAARWPENWRDHERAVVGTAEFTGALAVGQEYSGELRWDPGRSRWTLPALEEPDWTGGQTLTMTGPDCASSHPITVEATFRIERSHYEMVALVGIPANMKGVELYDASITSAIDCLTARPP
jgi:hypothetical protein